MDTEGKKEMYQGEERRRAQRMKLVTFCPAQFEYNGRSFHGLMVDISPLGAGFRLARDESEGFFLELNKEITYTIKTPYGNGKCTARTIWTRDQADGYCWGCEITSLSNDPNDPLRAFIDSPF